MLLRHSFFYLLARGLPGVLSFCAMMVYTRLLTAKEFGSYVLVLASVGFVYVVVFQWLEMIVVRYLPAHGNASERLLSSIFGLFTVIASGIFIVGGISVLVLRFIGSAWQSLVGLAAILLIVQSWLQINLSIASAQFEPLRYGYLLGCKNALALSIGALLCWLGFGAKAPILGLIIGSVVGFAIFGRNVWRSVRPRWPDTKQLREFAAYTSPLMVALILLWVMATSDRIIIAWLLDEAATGQYAAGYDLAQQSLGLLLVILNTAAYPIIMHKYEKYGESAAAVQLGRSGEIVVCLSLVGCALIAALVSGVVDVVMGKGFRATATLLLPWIAAAAAVVGIKSFYFDIAFQLARKPRWQAITGGIAAVTNVALNFLLIPWAGLVGAAWATLASSLLAACVSAYGSRKVFLMPPFFPILVKGVLLAALAYFGAWLVDAKAGLNSYLTAILGMVVGFGLATIGAVFLNVAGMRNSS